LETRKATALGLDKSGSPFERQAIDMACVLACRSVGRVPLLVILRMISKVFPAPLAILAFGRSCDERG